MELTSLLHRKRERVKRQHPTFENRDFQSCFSDSQYLMIHNTDTSVKNPQPWTAEFASIDQSDRIHLYKNEEEQQTPQKRLYKMIEKRSR